MGCSANLQTWWGQVENSLDRLAGGSFHVHVSCLTAILNVQSSNLVKAIIVEGFDQFSSNFNSAFT